MVKDVTELVPIAYYVYWIILIAIMVLVLGYWALRSRTGADTRLLTGVLVLLAGLLYTLEQLPVLHTHFDVVAGEFVAGYYEPLTQGFIRFGYKVAIAILLLSYAFSGVEKH